MGAIQTRPSGQVRAKVDLFWPWLSAASEQVLAHPDARAFYPEYLRAMYGISRGAVPLLRSAIARLEDVCYNEVPSRELINYFRHHEAEESGHDEWILRDLESIGIARSWTEHSLPQPAVSALVGAQFYMIEFHHPVALLGYLSVIERSQPTPEAVNKLRAQTGYPDAAFSCMRHHAIADLEHIREVYDVIDSCLTTAEHLELVVASALQAAELLLRVLTDSNSRLRGLCG